MPVHAARTCSKPVQAGMALEAVANKTHWGLSSRVLDEDLRHHEVDAFIDCVGTHPSRQLKAISRLASMHVSGLFVMLPCAAHTPPLFTIPLWHRMMI
jgi:hypothetical protein